MRLAPGPIPELTASIPASFAPEDPGFGALVQHELGTLPYVEGLIDDRLGDIATFDFPDPGAAIGSQLVGVDEEIYAQLGAGDTAAFDAMYKGAGESDQLMLNAFSEIPGEAWQPVPNAPGINGEAPPVPGPNPVDATISNLTHPGAAHFLPGDAFQLDIRVPPVPGGTGLIANLQISGTFHLEGTGTNRVLQFGTTNQNGFLTYQGVFDVSWVGAWTMFVNDSDGTNTGISALVSFVVDSAPGVAPTNVDVQFYPTAPASLPHLHPGDTWELIVSGRANQPVVIGGSFNGLPLTSVQIGTTSDLGGDHGEFVLDGVVSDAEIGNWVELYSVGGVAWGGQLIFDVT